MDSPETYQDWCYELAAALRALIDDESEGDSLRTLDAFDAWEAG